MKASVPHCPHCAGSIAPDTEACPACGFSLGLLMKHFGGRLVQLNRLTDSAHCLRLREVRHLESVLDEFERTFPQIFASVLLGVLPGSVNVNEIAFWLLNRAVLDTHGHRKLNEFAIALVIDPVSKTAGVTVGYALEPILTPKVLSSILTSLRTPLWHGEHASAIESCFELIQKRLKSAALRVRRTEDVLPPQSPEDFLDDSSMRTLRQTPPELDHDAPTAGQSPSQEQSIDPE